MRVRSASLAWLERILVAVGLVSLGYYGFMTAEARHFQREQIAVFESQQARARAPLAPPPDAPTRPAAPGPPASPPGVLALLEIPRLNISTPVLAGDDSDTLDIAVGHLPDTPLPWEKGNSAMAAHRDGLFRPLRNIRVGDDVRVKSEHGELTYRVRETKVVMPDDLSVLASTGNHTLTLITCYPFNFVGNAPKRFIVHADRLSADPE
jgi:sortase A